MKTLIAMVPVLFLARAFAADAPTQPTATPQAGDPVHRYLVERTFPPGALAGLDSATKERVNANNASVGVRWVHSYANADQTKTFCVYEGPSETAVRKAATLNALPVDSVIEVPVDLDPGTPAHSAAAAAANDGPSETAVRKAANANGIPVDTVTEVPVTVSPK
jgi:hypothetical protein